MALKATIFKAALNVADLDRQVYQDFGLTVARHPSETDERMMLRILAFALHAAERLEFGKGLSTDNEPDLWLKSLSDEIELWVELGLPEESRIRKACARAREVVIYAYGARATPVWWQRVEPAVQRFSNLYVYEIDETSSRALTAMAIPNMKLQCTVEDGAAWFSDPQQGIAVAPVPLFP